ncbi:MAG: response regulator [Rickettsiales bacterium]
MITLEQIKAARAMLNFSQKQLAEKAGIAVATLNNIERGAQTDPKISTMRAIREALESEGISFINEPLGGVGLTLSPKNISIENALILIIDDSKADRMLYKSWLSKAPGKAYKIIEAENAVRGFDAFVTHRPQCIILDFMMYGADGFQLLAAMKEENITLPPIIFITGMHNEILEDSAKSQGVHTYLNKQILSKEDLYDAVESALKA